MLSVTLLQWSDWALFIGRVHPLLVHLPIGFLVVAVLLEIGQRTGKISVTEGTKAFILLSAAIGATLSCIAGLLLASDGGYEEDVLSSHKWQGIAMAALTWIAWAANSGLFKSRTRLLAASYFPAFGLSVLLMFSTGHLGGVLTHGDGYLTQYAPDPLRALAGLPPKEESSGGEIKPLADVGQAVVYADIVQPILTARCVQCHGKSKQKGDLRLDDFASIQKGGEGGSVLTPGQSAESALIQVCLLPIEHDDHMPPKGKTQLTDDQISLISWWIDQGAPTDKKVAELEKDEIIEPKLIALGGGSAGSEKSGVVPGVDLAKLQVPEADQNTVAELKKLNLLVSPVSRSQNILEISAINAPGFSDAQIALLQKLSDQLVWLKVGGTEVTDKAMKEIGTFKNLNKLHLENTNVSDEGLAQLGNPASLEYLNLIGTKVSDASIQKISEIKSLRSVYLWQSAVTDSGMAQLKRLRPDLQVVGGLTEEDVREFLDTSKKDSLDKITKAE